MERASTGPVAAPYGTWSSPFTAAQAAAGSRRLSAVALDDDDVYWLEGRPDEGGRNVIVRCSATGAVSDVTAAGTNVRTRVHEYGGGAYVVDRGVVYYSEFQDQRLYRLTPGVAPLALTPPGAWCYADASVDPLRPRLVCVREDHTTRGREPVTTLVSVSTREPGDVEIIASGHDFYSTPRFSPDGSRLCWLTWEHPRMPWDGTELWLADVLSDGRIRPPQLVAGGERDAIFQPGWSPDGILYFASDRTGWWNLYRFHEGIVEPVCPKAVEFGRPQWQFGMATWTFDHPRRVVASYQELGRWRLSTISMPDGGFVPVPTEIEPGDNVVSTGGHAFVAGGSPVTADAVMRVDLETGQATPLHSARETPPDDDDISRPEPIEFPTDGGVTAYAFYYAPLNRSFVGPVGELPPLIVISHGGPTASTSTRLNLELQFWTSRGFGIVDVNYGGSSGYGREYRQRLRGAWGVVDVADCVNAAKYLAARGAADPKRVVIRGRSAGGFTTLAALAFHPGVFAAGASYYGVADLVAMTRDTHKFESRYLDGLVGAYPEEAELYTSRSPVEHAGQITSPVIFFHGAEDLVVPVNQCEAMANALRTKGLRVEVIILEGEQHGFRKKESVIRCLEAELAFYLEVFPCAGA